MARPTQHDQALVLRHTKLREIDTIVSFLNSEGAQVRAVCHGLRKPGSRHGAKLEPFSEVKILRAEGSSLDTIREVETVNSFARIRENFEATLAASVVSDGAYHMCRLGSLEPRVFDLTKATFYEIEYAISGGDDSWDDTTSHLIVIVAAYLLKALSMQGYRPHLQQCVLTGVSRPENTTIWFSPGDGGVVCDLNTLCEPGAVRLDSAYADWMDTLIRSTYKELRKVELGKSDATILLESAVSWTRYHLDIKLKSAEFLLVNVS